MTGILRDAPYVDAGQAERRGPALLDRCLEDDGRIRGNGEPGVAAELRLELAAAPACVAERDQHGIRAVAQADSRENVRGRRQLDLGADGERGLEGLVRTVQHEAALRLDGAAVHDGPLCE